MTHILIPREPNPALLRPFISCPEGQLPEAWAAMMRAAEVQNARAGRSCLAQIQEPAQPTSIVLDDRWKARILDGRALERDDMGLGDHPELPQLDEGMKPRGFFAALGLELSHTFAEDQLDGDALEAMGDAVNWTAWQPTPPQGDGWKLVAIFDTEDGPAAWWLRELAEAEDGTTTIRNLQAEIEKLKARMARVSRAGAAPAAVAGPAYSLDADPDGIRARAADAIKDALARGFQNGAAPPAGHWLELFWRQARFSTIQYNALRDSAEALLGAAPVGEVLDAANAALEPAAPALEAPAAPGVPDGWKLVPVEPTSEMKLAMHNAGLSSKGHCWEIDAYAAALAAAPQAPAASDLKRENVNLHEALAWWRRDAKIRANAVKLLIENLSDEDRLGDGRINTTRVRELLEPITRDTDEQSRDLDDSPAEAAPAAPAVDAEIERAVLAERERICAAIKAEDDHCATGDYMLDSDDCIKVARGEWVRPIYDTHPAAQAKEGGEASAITVLPLRGDESEESDLSEWQPGTSKPALDGRYLRDFDEGEAVSWFTDGKWTRDGFFDSDIQDAPWRGLAAQAAAKGEQHG